MKLSKPDYRKLQDVLSRSIRQVALMVDVDLFLVRLAEQNLAVLPVATFQEAYDYHKPLEKAHPLVLFFESAEEVGEFVRLVKLAKPGMKEGKLP